MTGAQTLLERVSDAGGRLLHVERVPVPGPMGARRQSALRLFFDVGVVELRAAAVGLGAEVVDADAAPDASFLDADEDEPWWAVLGQPLARVEGLEGRPGLALQLRPDEDNPRRISLLAVEGAVQVA